MFKIFATSGSERIEIHNDINPEISVKVIGPKLELVESNAGSFTAKIAPTNPGYDYIDRLTTYITIYRHNDIFWEGRVLSIKEDFWKNKSITCEGELAYLNDTTLGQEIYEGSNTRSFLSTILALHNEKVEDKKKVYLGNVNVMKSGIDFITNFETPIKLINDKLIVPYGGYIQTRKENDKIYLDYLLESDRPTTNQKIQFGSNLLDFTKSYDSTDFCTVVIPLGSRIADTYGISSSGIEGVSAYTTVEEAEEGDGSYYVVNQGALDIYGRIEKVVHWDDCEDPDELLELAKEYLESIQFDTMQLEVSAVDLGYMDINSDNIKLSDKIRVISKPHGLDRDFPITKISIPLDNPGATTFTMGATAVSTISAKTNTGDEVVKDLLDDNNGDFNDRFEKYKREILAAARIRAAQLIDECTTGYITIAQRTGGWNEFYITDNPIKEDYDPDDPVSDPDIRRYWRWNLHGLGFFDKDQQGKYWDTDREDLRIAITMNGEIVADYITTGILQAGIIKTGRIMANYGDSYWDMDTGEFYISRNAKLGNDTFSHVIQTLEDGIQSEMIARKNADDGLEHNYRNAITQTAEGFYTYLSDNYYTRSGTEVYFSRIVNETASEIRSEMSATYVTGNRFTEYVNTTTETAEEFERRMTQTENGLKTAESSIKQNATNIDLKVSKGDISSQISVESGTVTMNSNRLIINSSKFTLDSNGKISCIDADIYGTINVGGTSDNYGQIHVFDTRGRERLTIDSSGIYGYESKVLINYNGAWFGTTQLTSDGSIYGSAYGEIRMGSIVTNYPDADGIQVWYNGGIYRGSDEVVEYTNETGGRSSMRFVNGILIERW